MAVELLIRKKARDCTESNSREPAFDPADALNAT